MKILKNLSTFGLLLLIIQCTPKKTVEEENEGPVTLIAQFVSFAKNDSESYRFTDDAGLPWSFDGYSGKEYEFGILLEDRSQNGSNQVWVSNRDLEGVWFELIFSKKKQPLYEGGPLGEVLIIESARILDELESEN